MNPQDLVGLGIWIGAIGMAGLCAGIWGLWRVSRHSGGKP